MLGFDRRAARVTWTVALVLLAMLALYAIRKTAFVFLLAVFLSYVVYPAVQRVVRSTPRWFSHTAATASVFGLILIVVITGASLLGPPISDQASALAMQLPALLSDPHLAERIPLPEWMAPYRPRLTALVQTQISAGASVSSVVKQLGSIALVIAANLIYVLLIPILAFLLVKDASVMRDAFLEWVRKGRHGGMWEGIVDALDVLLGRYIRSLLLLSAATLLVYSLVFSIAGVPYALLLAALAAALEFIPVIGPLTAAVACVLVAGLTGFGHILVLVGFLALYRVFQDYVLNPALMSNGVEVPPLLILFGLLAGDEIAGIAGIFLSVPVLAAARIIATHVSREIGSSTLFASDTAARETG